MAIERKKKTKLEAFSDEFKGSPMFQIWEVTSEGEKIGDRPKLSIGEKKLKLIVEHLEDVKAFLGES